MATLTKPKVGISSASIEDIDDAVLVEVLCRGIPNFKIAFRCKLVSKRWRYLISSPIFPKRWKEFHRTLRPGEPLPYSMVINVRIRRGEDKYMTNYVASQHPMFQFPRFKFDYLPCSRPRRAASVRIAASCKDLFLCHAIRDKMELEDRVYYICNPLTRQWISLPPFPTKFKFMEGVVTGLVVSGDGMSYRVVRIHHDLESYTAVSFVAEVFSSDTNKWEEVEVPHPESSPFRFDFENKSYATNNLLCWNGLLLFENWIDHSIVAYNPFEPARCRLIEQPPRYRLGQYCRSFLSFGECNGSFRVVQHYDHPGGRHGVFMTWELEDYETEEWRFVNELVFRDFITDDDPLLLQCEMNSDDESDFDDYVSQLYFFRAQRIRLLTMDPNEEDVIYFYHSAEKLWDRRIFSCNLETKEVRVFDKNIIERCVEIDYPLRNVFQFVVPEWPTPIPCAPTECT
ncbi:unnamed protein product [Cuscuta campestris]|uniref:F-box protein At3g26010-like beta-propeller domain-containing protein n=1 Tax=Cuscuta campestris TaxID=132261 RepID=A0A484NMC9_9ASTE|nr:unnamed protein product [Cuscuta campestris]